MSLPKKQGDELQNHYGFLILANHGLRFASARHTPAPYTCDT
jgi:hypothetical protein